MTRPITPALSQARSTAARYRPAWRTKVGDIRTDKKVGDVEITSSGFERMTANGWTKEGRV